MFINEHNNETILLGGDFNTILNIEEKFGGLQQISQATKDFKYWIGRNNLTDILVNNGKYTWNNKRKDFSYIAEKLDRFFIKEVLSDFNFNIQSSILPILGSDHYPVRIVLFEPNNLLEIILNVKKCGFETKTL